MSLLFSISDARTTSTWKRIFSLWDSVREKLLLLAFNFTSLKLELARGCQTLLPSVAAEIQGKTFMPYCLRMGCCSGMGWLLLGQLGLGGLLRGWLLGGTVDTQSPMLNNNYEPVQTLQPCCIKDPKECHPPIIFGSDFPPHLQQSLLLMTTINPQTIWVLSALDKFMGDSKDKPELFLSLFEKKKVILQLLQSMKLDAKKYKAIVGKAYKEESGELRRCAQADLLRCKDGKSEEMVQAWFREMIENTGVGYEWQEKLYNQYKNKPSNNTQPPPATAQTTNNSTIGTKSPNEGQKIIDSLVSFKSIDDLLQKNEDNKDYYSKLLERKQKLATLVKSKALTAQKYKATLQACMLKVSEQLRSDYRFELDGIQDFHDGNVGAWFKEIIEESMDKLEEQMKIASSKQSTVKPKPVQPSQKALDKQMKELQSQKQKPIKKGASFDINSLNSFKIFDDTLDKLTSDKDKYREVLAKKKKCLDLASKGVLNGQKYKALLANSIKQAKDEEIREGMEFELSELTDFHDGNVQEWFKDVVSSSELMVQDQEKMMQRLEKGQKIKPKEDSDGDGDVGLSDDDVVIPDSDQQDQPAKKQPQKQVIIKPQQQKKPSPSPPSAVQPVKSSKMGKLGINPNIIFSLKALDEFMSEYGKDAQTFCICFQRKEAIFNMMKKGEITPQKYKQLQQSSLKTATHDKLKEAIEMDLFDLQDICDGDVMEWFENLVNDAGESFQEQQALYTKLKGGSKKQESASIVKPNIAQVVCFTAVSLLFDYCIQKTDVVYYRELLTKRERLLQLVTQKKLLPGKYREINKATSAKTDNLFLKNAISEEDKLLTAKFKSAEDVWFEQIFKSISKPPPQLKLPQNEEMKKVNAWPVDKKKKYLLCRMSPYESLLRYYNKHEVPIKNNKNILEYDKFKREDALKALQQLQKTPDLDIYNVAEQLFPPITAGIFYGDTLAEFKKKAERMPQLLLREISSIKEYSSKIKKATNPQNLQICKKEIAMCEDNIKYLKTWPRDELVGFPRIKEEKVEKYNLDIVRYLDKNQVQIEITHIEGVKDHLVFKIFVANDNNARFYLDVKNGPQNGIKTIVRLPNRDMMELYRGDKRLITFRLYQKGFFGGLSVVGEGSLQTNFIRSNIIQERVQVGRALVSYVLRIQKPSKPLITQIVHYELTTLPVFENDAKVEEELIKKYLTK